jgi:hypothetical protein
MNFYGSFYWSFTYSNVGHLRVKIQFNTSQMRLDAAAQLHAGGKYLANVKHLIKSLLLYRLTFLRYKIKKKFTHTFN